MVRIHPPQFLLSDEWKEKQTLRARIGGWPRHPDEIKAAKGLASIGRSSSFGLCVADGDPIETSPCGYCGGSPSRRSHPCVAFPLSPGQGFFSEAFIGVW